MSRKALKNKQTKKQQQHITGETRISKKKITTVITGTDTLHPSEYYAPHIREAAKLHQELLTLCLNASC